MTAIAGFEKAERAVAGGHTWGVALQRFVAPRDWPDALDRVPDADARGVANTYLRGIADRMRVVKRLKVAA